MNCVRQIVAIVLNDVGDGFCCSERTETVANFGKTRTQQKYLSFFDVATRSVPRFFVLVDSAFHEVDWKRDAVRFEHQTPNGGHQRNLQC